MSEELHNDCRPVSAAAQDGIRPARHGENTAAANIRIARLLLAGLLVAGIYAASSYAQSRDSGSEHGAAGEPPPRMPSLAPIGVRTGKYIDIPASAQGPAVDPTKGYRLQDLGGGLYMVTDNAYQSMFLVYDSGVVVIDAPPPYAAHIPRAIAEVSNKPVTHIVYSHSHSDHIGGAKSLGGRPVIIAHEETLRLLKRAADPNRPLPTVTFADRYTLRAGDKVLELSYHGNAHEPGNIFIADEPWACFTGHHETSHRTATFTEL